MPQPLGQMVLMRDMQKKTKVIGVLLFLGITAFMLTEKLKAQET